MHEIYSNYLAYSNFSSQPPWASISASHSFRAQGHDQGQTADEFGDQAEGQQVLGLDHLEHVVTGTLLAGLHVRAEAHGLFAHAVHDYLFHALEGAAADEQYVGGVYLYELLLGMLAPALGRHEVMTPRVDVISIDVEHPPEELTEDMMRHSRIPVYEGSIDNIIGVLPTKAFLKHRLLSDDTPFNELLVDVIYVHKTRMVSSIIREFRRRRLQMAVVLDEFGGTMGILTMEDIMEEIVGEIFDERDDVEEEMVEISDSTWQFDGGMNIYDM